MEFSYNLTNIYKRAHDIMRSTDGLQPHEAFDELLKILWVLEVSAEKRLIVKTSEDLRLKFESFKKSKSLHRNTFWTDSAIKLSETCLQLVYDTMKEVNLAEMDLDKRSAALRTFIAPEIRRGLGIFLTPDNVVRMMVEFVKPTDKSLVYDPACGSGTFLLEAINYVKEKYLAAQIREKFRIFGTDKSARMLALSELNLGLLSGISATLEIADGLDNNLLAETAPDIILTNPPFGVVLDSASLDFRKFTTCLGSSDSGLKNKQHSEIMFIERSLQVLKPGGILGIVLPRSVMNNHIYEVAREKLGSLGYIYAAVSLPAETFQSAGTQTSTVVLFIRKYKNAQEQKKSTKIIYADVSNVGFDSTGRSRQGDQLPGLAALLMNTNSGDKSGLVKVLDDCTNCETFSMFNALISKQKTPKKGKYYNLGDITNCIRTGRTPARAAYTDDGIFLIKVGNLTGQGIDWTPRDRNFADKKLLQRLPLISENDIVLTSSAHAPRYIAKKVDIIRNLPEFMMKKPISFVGEVMLIRVHTDFNPLAVYAFLKNETTVQTIQKMIRGQTAHLHADDVANLQISQENLFSPNTEIISLLEEQCLLAKRQNEIQFYLDGKMLLNDNALPLRKKLDFKFDQPSP